MKNIINIIRISKPLHHLVTGLAVLILTTSLLALVTPLLSKSIVDQIVAQVGQQGGSMETLISLILVTFGASLLHLILTQISERLGDHFAGRLRQYLTEKFYDKVLTLPQSYFDSEISGRIMNQLNRGIMTIYTFLNMATNFMLPTLLQSFLIVAILAYYSLPIAAFVFFLFPVYMVISYFSTKEWGKFEGQKNSIEDKTRGRMQEVISNMSLVKGYTHEASEYSSVSRNLTDINAIYATQSKKFHIFDFFRGLSLNFTLFAVNLLVFYNAFRGTLTIGEMVLILQLVNQARLPLFAMSFILTQIQAAENGSREYFEIINLKSTENYKNKLSQSPRINNPSIEFHNVSFAYEKSKRVLNAISFRLNANETTALVGPSGAGKSTIVNLILKFYEPTSGNITIKNKTYKTLDHGFIRNNIALVFQENELFSSTIRDNVAYGKHGATEKEIIEALKLANAFDFVTKLPRSIDSEIGERGVRLSGGQKQRIQIARAILKDAPILILDEATSSLDARSEKEVQEALENLMAKKTVLIIAHRFSTIQNVNRIIVLDGGSIADYGTPQELAKRKGIYSDLLAYQVQGNKKLLEKFELY